MSESFIHTLRTGCPLNDNTIIPWGTPLIKLSSFGNPEVKTWKRWGDTLSGIKEITHTSLIWKFVKVDFLPSLHMAKLEYREPPISNGPDEQLFHSLSFYFENLPKMERELIENFSEPSIRRVALRDRDGEEDYEEKIWTPVSQLRVSLILSPESMQVFMDPSEIRKPK